MKSLKAKKGKKLTKISPPVGDFYPIERILAYRRDENGNILCLVRWENFSPADDSWEPYENFTEDMKSEITSSLPMPAQL